MREAEAARALAELIETKADRFAELAQVAGLDPARDFRFIDMAGADLRGEDLRKFDFTGANFDNALIHAAQFNNTVTEQQLLSANGRNYATVILLGHSDAKSFRASVENLPRDFYFSRELSKRLDEHRGKRNSLTATPDRVRNDARASLPSLIAELHKYANGTDALFFLLSTQSISSVELAEELVATSPKEEVLVFVANPDINRKWPRQKFVRFKTSRVDGSWGRSEDLQDIANFLAATRKAKPLLDIPWRSMRGPASTSSYLPTVIAMRQNRTEPFQETIYRSVTYEGWSSNITLRLYVADTAYDRRAIIHGLKGRSTGRLEVYAFSRSMRASEADVYALLAEPDSTTWRVFPSTEAPPA